VLALSMQLVIAGERDDRDHGDEGEAHERRLVATRSVRLDCLQTAVPAAAPTP
jgi:hypothetical protein